MDFQELSSALSPTAGALLVGGGALRSDSISRLLGDFFDGAFQLLVDEEAQTLEFEKKDAIRVKGRLAPAVTFLGRPGWTVEAWFFIDNARAEVVFTLTPGQPDSWRIADGVEFRDCVFTLDSRSPQPLAKSFDDLFEAGAQLPAAGVRKGGMQLAANLGLASFDKTLSGFLEPTGAEPQLRLTGPVELVGDRPLMRLAAQIGPRLQFGKLDAQLSYEFLTAPIQVGSVQTLRQSTRERLGATLIYEYGDKIVAIPLAATFEPNAIVDRITIEGSPSVRNRDGSDEKAGLSLLDLAGLIPGDLAEITQPLDAFAELKNAFDAVELTNFKLVVRSEPLKIVQAYARLQTEVKWEIIKNLITFERVALDISATESYEEWSLRAYVTAEVKIAGGRLSARVDPLRPSFSCMLEEGSSIDAKQLLAIESLGLPPSPLTDPTAKFDITWFEINGDPVAKSYALDIATTLDWGFDLGATRLAVEQVSLSLEYTQGKPVVQLGGSLALGGVTARIGATYDSTNWTIDARAYDIRLNDILDFIPNVEQLRPVLPTVELPSLGLSMTPSTKAFKFDAECRIAWSSRSLGVDGQFSGDIALRLARAAASAPLTYDILLRGRGRLADPAVAATLDVRIQKGDENEQQVAVRGTLEIEDLTGLFPDGKLFPAVRLGTAVSFEYDTGTSALAFTFDQNIVVPGSNNQNIQFGLGFCRIGNRQTEALPQGSRILAGALLKTPIRLAPIAGDNPVGQLLRGMEISNVGIFYATEAGPLPPLFQKLFGGSSAKPPASLSKGPSFTANFVLGGAAADIDLAPPPVRGAADTGAPPPARGAPPATDARLRKWFKVDKAFGPLQISRIGAEWDSPNLGFLLDASVELVGLKVALAGLRLSIPPARLSDLKLEDISLGLDGLEISYSGGPVSIGGAFLKTPGKNEYSGMALIRAPMFAITAIGSYAQTDEGEPSLYIFGAYLGVIGGPPCFVVQGLAAGFGYNRALRVPPIEEVHSFPLVRLVAPPAGGSGSAPVAAPSGTSDSMLAQPSGDHFPVRQGQYWLAAGIKFTSFKLIDAFALVTVQFGVRFELALLGVARMQQPPKVEGTATPPKPFVMVELALSVRFAPDDGLLAARAVLTSNSYLFDTRCRLTGGFAFCIWFKPTDPKFADHSGDFVLTLGGYHPRFKLPDHYPRVPRVRFNWQLPDQGVTVKGECYFALTPSCIMAGCRLTAMYQSGDFAAWFEANANFLMAWAPFHYEADIGIWIGARFTTRVGEITSVISFQIGASLSIWGPEFAGIAYIDLGIASFTVHIGRENQSRTPEPIGWDEFSGRFIPRVDDKPAPLGVTITGGLIREDKKTGLILVNPSELAVIVDSYIPVTSVVLNDVPVTTALRDKWVEQDRKPLETKFGIRPLAKTIDSRPQVPTLDSELKVGFVHIDGTRPELESRPVAKGLPEALWSTEPAPSKSEPIEAKVINNALSGVRLFVKPQRPPKEAKAAPGLEEVSRRTTPVPSLKPKHASRAEAKTARAELGRMLGEHAAERSGVVQALQNLGFDLAPEAIDLAQLAECVEQADLLAAPPAFVALDQLPPMAEEMRQ
jgi:hypothetical protein